MNRLEKAAEALITDILARHPDEDLKCPLMAELASALFAYKAREGMWAPWAKAKPYFTVKVNDKLYAQLFESWDDAVRAIPDAVSGFVEIETDQYGLLQYGVVEVEVREKIDGDAPQA